MDIPTIFSNVHQKTKNLKLNGAGEIRPLKDSARARRHNQKSTHNYRQIEDENMGASDLKL